jgi:hypothetical protein
VLLKYHIYGLALMSLVAGVFVGGSCVMEQAVGRYHGPGGQVLYTLGMVLICALAVLAIRYGGKRVHRRAKAGMEQLQREVAVTLARERTRRKLQRKRRRGLFG